jgi:hypothetical protein
LDTPDQNWNNELLQSYIASYLKIKVSISTIWNHLRRIGYRSGRAKLSITSPDPDYQVKRHYLDDLKKKAQQEA